MGYVFKAFLLSRDAFGLDQLREGDQVVRVRPRDERALHPANEQR
jgi:hypothetical protein